MFSTAALAEFADKYGDHVAVTATGASASITSEVWRTLPVELVLLCFGALFIALRVVIDRRVRAHYAAKEHKRQLAEAARAASRPAPKSHALKG